MTLLIKVVDIKLAEPTWPVMPDGNFQFQLDVPTTPWFRCGGFWQGECGRPSTAFRICDGNFPVLQEQGGDIQGTRLSSGNCDSFASNVLIFSYWLIEWWFCILQILRQFSESPRDQWKHEGDLGGLARWSEYFSEHKLIPVKKNQLWRMFLFCDIIKQFPICQRFKRALSWTMRHCTQQWKWSTSTFQRSRWAGLCIHCENICLKLTLNVISYIAMKINSRVTLKCFDHMCSDTESMLWSGEERRPSAYWSSRLSDLLQGVFTMDDYYLGISLVHGCRWMSGYRRWLTTSFMFVMTPIRKDFRTTF